MRPSRAFDVGSSKLRSLRATRTLLLSGLVGAISLSACSRKDVAGGVPKGSQETEEAEAGRRARMAAAASVTMPQAIEIAIRAQPGTVIEVELEEHGGKAVWEVEIVTSDDRLVKVAVDASSGSVVAKSPE